MRRAFRLFVLFLAVLGVLLVSGYAHLRQSLPKTEGEIAVQGVGAAVEILRDPFGVPHIFAASAADAHFALGFVHAQDRLWQMEMSRRIAAGRLAEVLGPAALETDRFLRTLGVRRAAEANLRRFDGETQRLLDAYAAGVNAFLATNPVLPPEFWLLDTKPEPWGAVDSVAWVKMMAWDLGANWRSELLRLQLSRRLPLARIHEFLAPYPGEAPPQIRDLKELYEGLENRGRVQVSEGKSGSEPDFGRQKSGSDPDFPGDPGAIDASNSWAVHGSRTASGKPLLANDPHLGFTAPPVWYLAHLHAPGLQAIGGTLPGVPGILAGRNSRIAWGLTNTGADVQDLYLEKREGPFEERVETIHVKGAADERLTVRVSRHGPVISDVSRTALDAAPRGHVLALAWTALAEDDLSAQAALRLAGAHDWATFNEALKNLHAPAVTLTYADVDGNVGLIAAGRVPLRQPANDLRGLAPAPGWDRRYDWAGYVPFDELPKSFNAADAVVAANHKITPRNYPHHITSEWQAPYRARRIVELLSSQDKHDSSSFARMQRDAVSLAARDLMKFFPGKELSSWDGSMSVERAEPLLFNAWLRELTRAMYADELGAAFAPNWSPRAVFMVNALSTQTHWCDDTKTAAVESCDDIRGQSLQKALADLQRRYGENRRWGDAHVARHRHRPFSSQRWLAPLFDVRIPAAGDSYTVNAGRTDFNDAAEPYASRHGPSYRAIYDLGDPEASLFIQSAGQSGNVLSRHYRAFAEAWAKGEYVPMMMDREKIQAAAAQRLVLVAR
jgi:penicillin amidase